MEIRHVSSFAWILCNDSMVTIIGGMMTNTEKQKINEAIAEVMGWKLTDFHVGNVVYQYWVDPDGEKHISLPFNPMEAGCKALIEYLKGKCDHEWIDARNEVIKSGEVCLKCRDVRPSP